MEEKLGFFKRLIIAVAKPKEYWRTINQSVGKAIGFLAAFLVVTTLCGFPLDFIVGSVKTNGFKDIVEDYVPEFQLVNGRMYIDEVYLFDEYGGYFYADTSIDHFTYEDIRSIMNEGDYDTVILVSQENIVQYNNQQYQEINLKDFGDYTFTKNTVLGWLNYIPAFAIIITICLYIGVFITFLVKSLIYSVIGLILQKIIGHGSDVTFEQMFIMAINAKITMRIILAVTKILNVEIPYFNVMCIAVTIAYLCFGLIGLKQKRIEEAEEMQYRSVQPQQFAQSPYYTSNYTGYTSNVSNTSDTSSTNNTYGFNQNLNNSVSSSDREISKGNQDQEVRKQEENGKEEEKQ